MPRTRRELLRDGARVGAGVALGGALARGATATTATAAAAATSAPYAAGLRSLTDEVRLPHLEVDGRLPPWLRGVLVRNGPALFEIGEQQLNHWFDGLAMLHAFAFGAGRVSYANRFLRSSQYLAWKRTGKMAYSEFGTDPCKAIFSGVTSLPVLGKVPNANVSIERLGARFTALTEMPVAVRFDAKGLKTLGADGVLPTGRLGTAHPHHDPKTGERFAYEVELVPPTMGLRLLAWSRSGQRRELAFIPQERPGYLHSFALTARHVAVIAQPFTFDLAKFLKPGRGPIVTNYGWNGSEPARVVVVDRARGGVVATAEVDPFFVFHHVNAHDDARGRVVIDLCAHRDSGIVDALYLKKLRRAGTKVPQAVPRRITVDLSSGKAEVRDLAEGNLELPRVDERLDGREYRYAYGVGVKDPARSGFVDRVSKLDVARGELRHWDERGAYPGEPVFVARPGGTREDDGVLLSVVFDAAARTSYLLVLDARDLSEVARASVPHHIPFGFHGLHAS
jgi:carotenoid cleavage dioxygenase-like enzyme